MGFLANLFKSKELVYLEQLYKETKEDKLQLQVEVKELRNEIKKLNEEVTQLHKTINFQSQSTIKKNNSHGNNNNTKLSKSENIIFNTYQAFLDEGKEVTFDMLKENLSFKENSLRVLISKIRKKGRIIILN